MGKMKQMAIEMMEDDDDVQTYKQPWRGLNWGDMPEHQTNNFDFMEGARWAEKWLKENNNG